MVRRFYLESSDKDTSLPRHLRLDELPAIVGRHPGCELRLGVERISRRHALFALRGRELEIEDLGSTNGTFVNHERIVGPTRIGAGDVVHLADHEFRVMVNQVDSSGPRHSGDETVIGLKALPREFPTRMPAFLELLESSNIIGYMQPIVTAAGELHGCELLSRSGSASLTDGPSDLFVLAAALGSEVKLSRMMRHRCFSEADRAALSGPVFFNTHPTECDDLSALLEDIMVLRKHFPDLELVLEVHESAVTDLAAMAGFRRALKELEVALAYDDFGAGQARLLELTEVPPDYLKFDKALSRDLADEKSPRYRLLDGLNRMVADLGVKTVIEGVEDESTASLCRRIGIDYMQGFFFGRPRPILEEITR